LNPAFLELEGSMNNRAKIYMLLQISAIILTKNIFIIAKLFLG
jgi:hypothetical protein